MFSTYKKENETFQYQINTSKIGDESLTNTFVVLTYLFPYIIDQKCFSLDILFSFTSATDIPTITIKADMTKDIIPKNIFNCALNYLICHL